MNNFEFSEVQDPDDFIPYRYNLNNVIGAMMQSQVIGAVTTLPDSYLSLLINYCSARAMVDSQAHQTMDQYCSYNNLTLVSIIFHSSLALYLRSAPSTASVSDIARECNKDVRDVGFITDTELKHHVFEQTEGFVTPDFCFANLCSMVINGETFTTMGYVLPLLETIGVHTSEAMIKLLQCSEVFFGKLMEGYTEIQAMNMLQNRLSKQFKPATKQ